MCESGGGGRVETRGKGKPTDYSYPPKGIPSRIKAHAGRTICVIILSLEKKKTHPAPAKRSARPLVDANLDDDDATPATRGSRALRAAADANIVWVYGVLFVRASRRRLGSAFGLKAEDG